MIKCTVYNKLMLNDLMSCRQQAVAVAVTVTVAVTVAVVDYWYNVQYNPHIEVFPAGRWNEFR